MTLGPIRAQYYTNEPIRAQDDTWTRSLSRVNTPQGIETITERKIGVS